MRRVLTAFVRAVGWLDWSAALFGAALLAGIAGIVVYEIVARYVFQSPTEWSFEIATYALVWCGFLGAARALARDRHVQVDLLLLRLSGPARRRLETVTDLLAIVFCLLVVREGIRFAYTSYVTEATSVSPLRVPLFLPELVVPGGIALLALRFLARILTRLGLAREGEGR